ncbi:HNH endonuclease [Sinorhizobium mexicanum]|nr:HNH endonuclease [Sinorhizobium mexicanum]MBP1885722.1 5-methylcytosine-specific restriction protein A [Sinorhizobium mexicanum]
MSELVQSIEDVVKYVDTIHNYGQGNGPERRFHDRRIKNGKIFIAVKRGDDFRFAPRNFAGYRNNDLTRESQLSDRDGRVTDRTIEKLAGKPILPEKPEHEQIDRAFLSYCAERKIEPSKHHMKRRYWLLTIGTESVLPEEILDPEFWEGAKIAIQVNRFERSQQARKACTDHYGYTCRVCEVNLVEVYGEIAREFIHVHHIIPLSEVGEGYKVDPVADLRPVCPNCHAMLHRRREPLSIDELRARIGRLA